MTTHTAYEIGCSHGANAAEWYLQDTIGGRATGDTREIARKILQGIDEGDPAIEAFFPGPDLSGQWSDGYSVRELNAEVGNEDSENADFYEHGFSEEVSDRIAVACRELLEG